MSGNSPLRVVFLNHWAEQLGGAEISLLDILEESAPRAENYLICSEEGPLVSRARELGVICKIIQCAGYLKNVRRGNLLISIIREWKQMLRFLIYLKKLRHEIKHIKPDIIHANIPKSHVSLFFLVLMGFRGRCVFHIREIFDSGSVPFHIYNFLFPHKNSCVIAISEAVKKSLPVRIRKYTDVIYNGVKVDFSTAAHLHSHIRFLFLGRIVPWKGCHLLIDAFSRVHSRLGADAGTLDFIGGTFYWDNSYRENLLERIESAGLSESVRLFPHISDPFEAFASHDVLCMASDREPFGRVAAEAQGFGLPVIGFDDGGLPEIVENGITGILVKKGDIDAMADAMERLVKDPVLRVSAGEGGHKRISRFFNRKKQIPLIVNYIFKV